MSKNAVLAIHGGAGTVNRSKITPQKEREYENALRDVLHVGQQALSDGSSALDVVTQAVRQLEDCPLFNAGKGAVYTSVADHELDASIMDGESLQAGAVAQLRHVRNPIEAARALMASGQYVLLTGAGADAFARNAGLSMVDQSYYATPERLQQLHEVQKVGGMRLVLDHDGEDLLNTGEPIDTRTKFGTVGAVARDIRGNLAAANSTGGMTNKTPGRVGDSAVIGAGCYADNRSAAVATTGTGETFIRAVAAYDVCALMRYAGLTLEEATRRVIHESQIKLGGQGGLIAVDAEGNVALPFNTAGMYRGYVRIGEPLYVAIYR
ncbi:isoaspartyl peptidase/L-asparaginase family protein [Brenneria goodwinii]|uniref:Isoaspartyl peptidase n=1 Tax=Brenneria goodwinii TaxID=1109412 RepID=A0A0G4K0J6_9GAMM|nr:isoaspartyl peptidase/L-asparaginase [Brenneria goodwinii]CPR19847.1 Isoaspartyl aminopeptidase @ Asp-X dipeptidase [Brenneria goodwinii]